MESGVRRWLVNLSQWNPLPEQFEFLVSLLPIHERSPITRFVKFEDKKRALVSRLLQYSLVHEVLGIPFDKIIINRTIEGKPYLSMDGEKLAFKNFNFNASHHGDYVGIASEPLCLVGLDIISIVIPPQETALEFIRNFSPYFTDLEWKKIINAGDSNEILMEFYRYWCLKEAYVKALGAGIGHGLQRLEFHHTNWTNITLQIDGEESKDSRFWLYEIGDGHWAAVARGHPRGAVESFRRTFDFDIEFEDGEFWDQLLCPNPSFTLRKVEQLIPVSHKRGFCSIS